MKKYLISFRTFVYFALVFSVITSCGNKNEPYSKPAHVVVEQTSIDNLRLFFEKLHPNDQLNVFQGLPFELKYALVNNHWETQLLVAENHDEKEFIQSLIDHLKPAYYDDTALFNKEGAQYFKSQSKIALALYHNDKSKVYSILHKIGGDSEAAIYIATEEKEDCECNVADGRCFFGTCAFFDNCKVTINGCGNAWLWPCDGMCQIGLNETATIKEFLGNK